MAAIKQSNVIFLSISDGKIIRRFSNPTADSVSRTTKEGKIVHEEIYKGWGGKITDIQFKDHPDFGRFVNVFINDGSETAMLQIKQSSGYANAFMKTLPNIDFESEVSITPNIKIEGDKKKTGLFIIQHGTPVKWAFTKDNPNNIPQLKKTKFKGKDVYDDSEILEFFEKMVNTDILPKIKKVETVEADNDEAPF